MSYNKVMLIGRLGRDPELRYTPNGYSVANFPMATDESYTDREGNRQKRTEWHRIVVWNKQAESTSKYLSKGRQVFVEGSLQTRKWQDQQGVDRYTTEIKAVRVVFLGSNEGNQPSQPAAQTAQQSAQSAEDPFAPSAQDTEGVDDIPF